MSRKKSIKPSRSEAVAALEDALQYATRLMQHGLQDDRPEIQSQDRKDTGRPEGYVLETSFEKGAPLVVIKQRSSATRPGAERRGTARGDQHEVDT